MERDIRIIKSLMLAFMAVLLCYLLMVLSGIIIPLFLALFIALLLQPVLAWLQKKRIPFSISLLIILLVITGFFFGTGTIVYETGRDLVSQKEILLDRMNQRLETFFQFFEHLPFTNLSPEDITGIISGSLSKDFILASSQTFAEVVGSFSGNLVMTLLYLIAFLGSIMKYEQYLEYLEDDYSGQGSFLNAFEEVKNSIVTYMKVHTLVSVLTGLAFYITCLIFGVKFALFWGFLAFVLNYIPTIGSITATIPPALLGIIEFDSFGTFGLFVGILVAIQFLLGNVLEPALTGKKLALNTVAVILGLVFWGYLWGIIGLLLSVPLLVLVKVILSQIPEAQVIVRLMGKNPDIKSDLFG